MVISLLIKSSARSGSYLDVSLKGKIMAVNQKPTKTVGKNFGSLCHELLQYIQSRPEFEMELDNWLNW